MKKPDRPYLNLRAFVYIIGVTFLLVQIALLVINFMVMFARSPEESDFHIKGITDWFIDRLDSSWVPSVTSSSTATNRTSQPENNAAYKEYVVKKSGDFLAIPVTVNVVLILSDFLVLWATASKSRLLLLPWLVLHAFEFVFFIALLVFLMVTLVEPWIKVVMFLIGCPVIILLGFFWFVVKCFHNLLGSSDWDGNNEVVRVLNNGGEMHHSRHGGMPTTVYATEPGHWDQPVPVWAVRPPQSAWDPEFLQSLDPRYVPAATPGSRRPPSAYPGSRPASSRSRSRPRPAEQRLPDGTIVVPLADVDDDYDEDYSDGGGRHDYDAFRTDGYLKHRPTASAQQPPKGHHFRKHHEGARKQQQQQPERPHSANSGSMRSLSSKYNKTRDDVTGLVDDVTTADHTGISEDRSSVSLSDKYRTQEEIEVFNSAASGSQVTNSSYKPPPEPIRPKFNKQSEDSVVKKSLTHF